MAMADVLIWLGRQVRRLREARDWSRRELATRADLSERFLAEIEKGTGNISVRGLDRLAAALETTPSELLARRADGRVGFVALLGLRGAGKSTVGPMLASELGRAFIELDALVERAAGLSAGEIFALHGEEYFRRLERDVLARHLAESAPSIIAAGGGLVADPATFDLLRRQARTVWLKATPERHWSRVVAQGDTRPMADHPAAMAELRRLWAARAPLYAEADVVVDTTDLAPAEVCDRVAQAVARAE